MRHPHNLSHEHKFSTDMGLLIPVGNVEVLPGDTFIHGTSIYMRVAPLVNPVMHNVTIRLHHWFVPNRLLWDEWEKFIVGKDTNDMPKVTIGADDDLLDHFGVPPATGKQMSALPVRAYNLVYNEHYRDQDLQSEVGLDQKTVLRCAWEKDYFTTARDVPQQGEEILIPFQPGTRAPVLGIGPDDGGVSSVAVDINQTDGTTVSGQGWHQQGSGKGLQYLEGDSGYPDIWADLSAAEGGGISTTDLKQSMALATFAEVRSWRGSRYVDYLRYLGVNPGDARLDRPEFLGGGSQQINFSEVLATAEGTETNVGDMYGHGIAGLRARRYRRKFNEHGWVLSLMSVRPKTVYMDGIHRKFQRYDPMDYWQKEMEVMPWQDVKMPEIHHAGDADTVFGYVPKHDEYRHETSYVSGSFRDGPELDWHMARKFDTPPTLNGSFITCDPTDRIYQDTVMPELLCNAQHSIRAKRLVQTNSSIGKVFGNY